jgi:hypothetical protein
MKEGVKRRIRRIVCKSEFVLTLKSRVKGADLSLKICYQA